MALSITYFPDKKKLFAIFFGCDSDQIEFILNSLTTADYAWRYPFTLINAFLNLEKAYRFDQVERCTDQITDLVQSFRLGLKMAEPSILNEDDPKDLVGFSVEVDLLRNSLSSWTTELRRLRKCTGDFPKHTEGPIQCPLQDAEDYLERLIDEYNAKVRQCEALLSQISMTFQMVSRDLDSTHYEPGYTEKI